MLPDVFRDQFHVSDDVMARLTTYHDLLLKWQKTINLVGPNTLDSAWARHFADSAQVLALMPPHVKTIVDLGSGAGFPGLVLSIMNPDLDIHLVEVDERKAQFLRTVSRETQAKTTIHTERIEALDLEDVVPDLVTARALAPLSMLLEYTQRWTAKKPETILLFLKGASADQEINQARDAYDFSCETHKSITAPQSGILFISDVIARL